MKFKYTQPCTRWSPVLIEKNLLASNQLPGSGSEKFNDDGEFDWGDGNN